MRHLHFAWPKMAMPGSFMLVLLFLLGMSGGCKGQVTTPPAVQGGSDTTQVANKAQPSPSPIPTDGIDPRKGKPRVEFNDITRQYKSYAPDGTPMDFDWRQLPEKSKLENFTLPNAKIIQSGPIDYQFRYKINGDYERVKTAFEAIGVNVPISVLKKSFTLEYRYMYSLYGTHMYAHLSVQFFNYVDERDFEETDPIFIINKVEVYNYKGQHIAHIESPLPIAPAYVFAVSDDDQYVLMGTSYYIGDGEGYYGDFFLYDTKSHKMGLVPKMDIDKYANNGFVQSVIFDAALFQIVYYNGTEGMRFMIDPYKRLLYYRYYPRPTLIDIYRGPYDITLPTLPDGTIKEVSQYEITSF